MKKFKTPQEVFWEGEFGNDYINRNKSTQLLASNLNFFSRTLHHAGQPKSLIEFGANIGMNLKAIQSLYPNIKLTGIEINAKAAKELSDTIGKENVIHSSIFDYIPNKTFEVALIKGVLIHINPEMLHLVYQKLYDATSKYILVCEYYNPTPVSITYRGHDDRLFKRDFAGEILDKFSDLELVDYGFVYKRDRAFPQDDVTWFLIKKNEKV